jgi:nickel superoxide dismutase
LKFLKAILNRLPVTTVYAHCDIPCGVYSAEPAKIAALAVQKLTDKMLALPMNGTKSEMLDCDSNFMRIVFIKEREAQRCKDELLVLWADYFKPEHLDLFPDLHSKFWAAAKQCSLVKRGVSKAEAASLVKMVDELAGMFTQIEATSQKK